MNGTRESVILRGGIRESITSTLQELGSPLTRIYEETDLRENPKKPSHATASWDRVSIPPTNVFNLMSRMTIHVENITRLYIYYKDPLCTVLNYARNFGNAAKEGLNPVGGLLSYKSKVLVSCTRTYHDPALPVFKCYHLYQ